MPLLLPAAVALRALLLLALLRFAGRLPTAGIATAAQHGHFIDRDFRGVAVLPVLVLPLPGFQASLDVDQGAFAQVLPGDCGELR